jgi:hypothetical protein
LSTVSGSTTNVGGSIVDLAQLTPQLAQGVPLPGVALLIAYDAIESAVVLGRLPHGGAADLGHAADHLDLFGKSVLRSHPTLVGELRRVATTNLLPESDRLAELRTTLADLVQEVPAEGSVPADADYLGF